MNKKKRKSSTESDFGMEKNWLFTEEKDIKKSVEKFILNAYNFVK